MKRILTIICAITFSGAALSAQNNVDTIKVCRNESDTIVVIVKEKPSIDRQAKSCYNILQPNTSQGVSLYPQTISVGLAYKWGKR